MFSTFAGFFTLYIPLVILAIAGILYEEKLISFERKLKRKIRRAFQKRFMPKTHRPEVF